MAQYLIIMMFILTHLLPKIMYMCLTLYRGVAPAKNTESLTGVLSRQKSRLDRVNFAIVNKKPVGRTAIHVMVILIPYIPNPMMSDIEMFLLMCANCDDTKPISSI